MLSKKTWHCLDILIAMASVPETTTISTQTLAQTLGLSISHLESLMRQLREAGLVQSYRGPGGGYGLCRPAHRTTLWEVVSVLEQDALDDNTEDDHESLTRPLEAQLKAVFAAHLSQHTLSEFAKEDPRLLARSTPRLAGFRLAPMPPAWRPVAPNSVFQLPHFVQGVAA